MVSPSGEQRLSFGPFEADLSSGKLYKLGRRIPLQNKPFRLLAMLLARPREVVTREEVRKELWPDGTFVDFEEGLDTALKKLRHALGDSAQNPNFIETLPRRGYRFIAPSFRFDLVDQSTPAKAETHATKTETEGAAEAFTLAKGVRWLGGSERFWIGLAVAIAIVLGSILGWRLARQAKAAPANIESLAVLPLENLSGDPSQDYFAAGMTEELITALGQINSLRVISRTSVMQYRGIHKPLPQVARELKVDAIVEGTVTRSGELVRITAQLIQAPYEKQLWAQTYQREFRDSLGLQNEIAGTIAKQVQSTLRPQAQTAIRNKRPVSPEAYEAYWNGEYHLDKLTPESVKKAAGYFEQAITKDPDFVAAYNKLAGSYRILGNLGVLPKNECNSKANDLTAKALALDPLSGAAHAQVGWGELSNGLNFPKAGAEFRRAVELNPNGTEAHEGLGDYYAAVGQVDRAVAEMERAREVDPLSLIVNEDLCRMLYFSRRFDDALAQCKANLELDPQLQRPLWQIGAIYAAKGMNAIAASVFLQAHERVGLSSSMLAALKRAEQETGLQGLWREWLQIASPAIKNRMLDSFQVAEAYTYAGYRDQALTWLERAFEERSFGINYLGVDPTYDGLRSAPRFQELLRRMRLPQ